MHKVKNKHTVNLHLQKLYQQQDFRIIGIKYNHVINA